MSRLSSPEVYLAAVDIDNAAVRAQVRRRGDAVSEQLLHFPLELEHFFFGKLFDIRCALGGNLAVVVELPHVFLSRVDAGHARSVVNANWVKASGA